MAPAEKKQSSRASRKAAAEGKAPAKVPKTTRKRAPKAVPPQVRLVLQYMGREISQAEMQAAVIAAWQSEGRDSAAIQTMDLYVKPEDNAVYYVINGEMTGKVQF